MRARSDTHTRSKTQMTISGDESFPKSSNRLRRSALVIIATSILGIAGVRAAPPEELTTSTGAATIRTASLSPGSAPPGVAALAKTAAALTTLIVEGSSVYQPPQLFPTYRGNVVLRYHCPATWQCPCASHQCNNSANRSSGSDLDFVKS
jgi:hypothetical protein